MGFSVQDIPVVGGLLNTLFGNQTKQQKDLTSQIAKLQGLYAQYRPLAAQGQMQGLSQQLGAFAPINSLLGHIEGQGSRPYFNLNSLMQNPMPQSIYSVGAPGQPPPPSPGATPAPAGAPGPAGMALAPTPTQLTGPAAAWANYTRRG